MRQEQGGQVVDGEAQLVAVYTLFTSGPTRPCADACIVDEHVEALLVGLYYFGELPDGIERREISIVINELLITGVIPDLLKNGFSLLRASAVQENGRIARSHIKSNALAEAVGGARDQNHLILNFLHHIHHLFLRWLPIFTEL